MSMIATTWIKSVITTCVKGKSRYAHLATLNHRHHDLALRLAVAGDVSRKLLNVGNKLRLACCSCGTADTTSEGDGLACDLVDDVQRLSRIGEEEDWSILCHERVRG